MDMQQALQNMRGKDSFCLEGMSFLLALEGTKSLGNPGAPDLIPKLILLYTSGKQGKDSRHGGLKKLSEYEESRLFNWKTHRSSPFSKQRMTSCQIGLVDQGCPRTALISNTLSYPPREYIHTCHTMFS